MTVYVDDAVTLWRGHRWAHLMADTLDELHDFAARLGIPRRAFQDKTSGAHYDVTAQLRERAIALGAMPISRHDDRALMRRVIANARAQGRRDAPEERNVDRGSRFGQRRRDRGNGPRPRAKPSRSGRTERRWRDRKEEGRGGDT